MTEQEFWQNVSKTDTCWHWTGSHYPKGYGRATMFGTEGAHRVAYILANGSIPKGLQIDHLCRVKGCVNPDHLEAVTPAVNTQRGLTPHLITEYNRRRGAERTHCPNGHPYSGDNLMVEASTGKRRCRTCRRRQQRDHRVGTQGGNP
jgi:hypothetical protein